MDSYRADLPGRDGGDATGALVRAKASAPGNCRANSRRGSVDRMRASYPPVEAVRRALEILRIVNHRRITTVGELHLETGLPKPTIVRMLDTLVADGYVARDNLCGGYRVTRRVRELDSGYEGIAQIIEVARPFAIDLTHRIKWPIGIGTLDGDAIALQFWTGAISPWVHASTLIGNRPNLVSSAMGRAYLAFCGEEERAAALSAYRAHSKAGFTAEQEEEFQLLLAGVRKQGHALRAPQTEPRRNTTVAVPIRPGGKVMASVTVSFFTSAIPRNQMSERVIEPLKDMVRSIENVISFMRNGTPQSLVADARAGDQDFGL